MSGLEVSSKIVDGMLAAKETGEKLHLEFVKNRVTSHNISFFETVKKSGITYKEEKKDTKGNFIAEGGLSSFRIVCFQMYG